MLKKNRNPMETDWKKELNRRIQDYEGLITQPISRAKVLFSKYISVVLTSVIVILGVESIAYIPMGIILGLLIQIIRELPLNLQDPILTTNYSVIGLILWTIICYIAVHITFKMEIF